MIVQTGAVVDTFQSLYGFEVVTATLSSAKNKPNIQRQFDYIIANFLNNYDAKEVLMILYYADHGWTPSSPEGDSTPGGMLDASWDTSKKRKHVANILYPGFIKN